MRTGKSTNWRMGKSANCQLQPAPHSLRFTLHVSRFIFHVFLLSLFFLPLPLPVIAQSDVISLWESDVPPEAGWTVGDSVPLRLRVIAPAGTEIVWPEFPAQWGDFEILKQDVPVVTTEEEKTISILAITTVLWSPGGHETPALTLQYKDTDGEIQEVKVNPLSVNIASVLVGVEPGTDGQIEKQDLKAQATLPRPPLWPWILAGIVAAPLLYLAGRWLWQKLPRRKSKATEAIAAPIDNRFPEEIAYERLSQIETLNLPQQGAFKDHYSQVIECVRAYLEGIYAIPALDRTTYELLLVLRRRKLPGDAFPLLRESLEEADLIKFAKFVPTTEAAYRLLTQARHIVDVTKPERGEEAEEQGRKGVGERGSEGAEEERDSKSTSRRITDYESRITDHESRRQPLVTPNHENPK